MALWLAVVQPSGVLPSVAEGAAFASSVEEGVAVE